MSICVVTGGQCCCQPTEGIGCPEVNALKTRLIAAENKRDDLLEALQRIAQWGDAYPLDIFPAPDWETARAGLKAVGITLDAVSAANMRHVVEGVGKIAKAALKCP